MGAAKMSVQAAFLFHVALGLAVGSSENAAPYQQLGYLGSEDLAQVSCSTLSDCYGCAANHFCGWCASTASCTEGKLAAPLAGSCTDWRFNGCGVESPIKNLPHSPSDWATQPLAMNAKAVLPPTPIEWSFNSPK